MNSEVYDILLAQRDTPLGVALNTTFNAQWLTEVMYASPTVALLLPTNKFLVSSTISAPDAEVLIRSVSTSKESIEILTNTSTEAAFFLAESMLDKLAIASYALYLNGRK